MSARANWAATAAGTAVGTGGWILGLGKVLWRAHPLWALFFLTLVVTVVTLVLVEEQVRHGASRAHS